VNTLHFRKLSAHEQLIVAIGVLMDGSDTGRYLQTDAQRGEILAAAALELSQIDLTSRLPFVGTLVRLGLERDER
jgi:hypothetical protein